MKNFLKTISVSTLVCGFAAPVYAQSDGLVYSNNQVISCLNESEMPEEFQSCIGRSADACVNANSLGRSTIGTGGCISKELDFWDARLNRVYREVKAFTKQRDIETAEYGTNAPSSEAALLEMQRAWIPHRDKKCAYVHTQFGGGTGAGPGLIWCLMTETAEQTLFLEQGLY